MIFEGNISQLSCTCCNIEEAVFKLIGKIAFIATHLFAFTSVFTFIQHSYILSVWKRKRSGNMCAHCETLAIPVYLKLLLYIKIEWTLALAASRHVWEAACKFTNLRERAALYFSRGPSCRIRTTGSRCQRLFFVASLLNSSQIVRKILRNWHVFRHVHARVTRSLSSVQQGFRELP